MASNDAVFMLVLMKHMSFVLQLNRLCDVLGDTRCVEIWPKSEFYLIAAVISGAKNEFAPGMGSNKLDLYRLFCRQSIISSTILFRIQFIAVQHSEYGILNYPPFALL